MNGPVAVAAVWIWNDRANAVSHCRTTWLTVAVAPRSTWIHCGSLNADDHRVPVLPSTAAEAGEPAFSVEDAVAGFPCEISGSAAAAVPDSPATATVAAIVTAETAAASSRLGPRATVRMDMAPAWIGRDGGVRRSGAHWNTRT